VSSPEEECTSIDSNDLFHGFNNGPPADVVSLAAPRSIASTFCETESDGAPSGTEPAVVHHDSSSRYDARHAPSDAESDGSSYYSYSCSGSSYSDGSSYSYSCSYSYSDSRKSSPENSPAKVLKEPHWCAVDTAQIRPHVEAVMQSMLQVIGAEPIDVTQQYAPKARAKAAAKGKAKAQAKSKGKGKAKRKAKAKGKAISNAASTPAVGAPATGSLATPSSGAPVRYGCSTCRHRPHGVRCKTKWVFKTSCAKLVKA